MERPIPIPLSQRWRDLRQRFLPVIVFFLTISGIAILWRDNIAAPTMQAQAEPIVANVSCTKAGLLGEFTVNRFQKVRKGDAVGQVVVTEPKILASSLAVIQAEIEVLRVNLKPIASQQQTAMDYSALRLDWMKERAQLAAARVNLQLAESEYHRMDELFRDRIVSQRVFDQAQAARDRLRSEIEELTHLVAEGEQGFIQLQLTNTSDLKPISTDPVLAAIAVQEAKLRLTEAELSPVVLYAPMDGVVSIIHRRPGESVGAGQPIASIATANAVRLVGYLRPPIGTEPKVGMAVQVHTRGMHRESGTASIIEVGAQLEAIPPALQPPVRLVNSDLGLPVDISLPLNLAIRPGEIVDVSLRSAN